ncbi:MAG TPA: response regulator transcription factor, partial [Baekduia sp.]|nr:response regulator transcription factor [Baekduia sp.]
NRATDATTVAVIGDGADAVGDLLAGSGFALADDLGDLEAGDVAVIVLETAGASSIAAIGRLAEACPAVKILAVMPDDATNAALRRALIAGAHGLVIASDVESALVATTHAMLVGQLTVPSALGRQIAPRPLSHREKEIIGLVVLGLTNREIAQRLFLSESTVKTHLSSAFRKLDARSRSEVVARITDPETGYGMGILAIADAAGPDPRTEVLSS